MSTDVTVFRYFAAESECPHPSTEVGRLWAYDHTGRAVGADWTVIEADHHDGDRLNNDPSNLLLACSDCNKARARAGNPTEWSPA